MRRGMLAFLLVALAVFEGGCMGLSFGGGSTIHEAVTPPTIGRELEDLDAARKSGAISQEEFERCKLKLISEGRKF